MLKPITCFTGLALLLLSTGCLIPPVAGKINCDQPTQNCNEFITAEGLHMKFTNCNVTLFKKHYDAAVWCEISNPTGKDIVLHRNDFRIASPDAVEWTPEKFATTLNTHRMFSHPTNMPDDYPVKAGQKEIYVFSARTSDKHRLKDLRALVKETSLIFLHRGSNPASDTLFTMQWKDQLVREYAAR